MTGKSVAVPSNLAGYGGRSVGGHNAMDASFVNSFRIASVADRLATHLGSQQNINVVEFSELCFSLARGVDFAITNQDVPAKAPELPSLLKQVCRRKYDPFLQAAVMVLMISMKSACKSGWFSEKDSEDLCHLANEMSCNFCSATDFKSEPSGSQSIISAIMSRFFPTMKMGHILAFLEVKPGYGAFINDFHISKNGNTSPEEKIRLLVAQIDNMETSSCLISPPQANFLLNGNGVVKRTNILMETGPQVPTAVSHMLRYGTNLLQAVGEFNGNYLIAVAYMSKMSTPDSATLLNFLQPARASADPESDIIEGPSRISLNCPISFKRIKTPVKGHSCKHHQCFDYDNYVDINSRRPSWRCPLCNQPVCFTDIRIDQDIVKVLKEVGDNSTDVIICSDGSWNAVTANDDHNVEKTPEKCPEFAEGETVLPSSNGSSDIMDLTALDDEMDTVNHKPHLTNHNQAQPYTKNPSDVNQASLLFWSGAYLSKYGLGSSSSTPNLQIGSVSNFAPNFITDALTPTSVMQGGVSSPNTLQQYQFGGHTSRTTPSFAGLQVSGQIPGSSRFSAEQLKSILNQRAFQGLTRSCASSFSQSMGAVHQSSQTARPDAFRGDQSGNMSGTGTVPVEWRPTGRMRGSLSGQAYTDALNQYIIRPTQQAQPSRPATPPNVSAQLQALIAKANSNRDPYAYAMQNPSSTG